MLQISSLAIALPLSCLLAHSLCRIPYRSPEKSSEKAKNNRIIDGIVWTTNNNINTEVEIIFTEIASRRPRTTLNDHYSPLCRRRRRPLIRRLAFAPFATLVSNVAFYFDRCVGFYSPRSFPFSFRSLLLRFGFYLLVSFDFSRSNAVGIGFTKYQDLFDAFVNASCNSLSTKRKTYTINQYWRISLWMQIKVPEWMAKQVWQRRGRRRKFS